MPVNLLDEDRAAGRETEVVPVAGVPAIRPMRPLIYVFDHRLFDGVLCSRILQRLGEVLLDPRVAFGPDGRTEPDR